MPKIIDFFLELFSSNPYRERPIKVLIVEDDGQVARTWLDALQGICKNIVITGDLATTMSYLSDNKPDILILDWVLPNGDGGIILNHWLSHIRGPVAIASGNIAPGEEVGFYQRGAWHVLVKPFRVALLASVVTRYTEIVRGKDKLEWVENELATVKKQVKVLAICLLLSVAGQQIFDLLIS